MENLVLMTNSRPDHPDCTHFPLFFLAETLIDEITFSSCSKSIRNQVRRIISLLQKPSICVSPSTEAFGSIFLILENPGYPEDRDNDRMKAWRKEKY
ncbi:unnamed protein product [Brassica rapa]|uniref:Uncharacterized protein n=1 Tax=Brassica campestris TaxID=3711 RepID=A0A8D9GYL6_BRACM|nr:unnamed protein product [Brassica rapa]